MSDLWNQLNRLARNLWWSWDVDATRLFRRLDPAVWEASRHSPVAILDTLGEQATLQRLDELDLGGLARGALARFEGYASESGSAGGDGLVGYFCAEFGIHESMPIYAGGLGVLAGDHLKSASDLAVPMVAVGLLYREGYFTQLVDSRGRQRAYYRRNDMERMGLELLCDSAGRFRQFNLPGAQGDFAFAIWHTDVGRVPLYLLDVGLWQNRPADREPTQRLYGGVGDIRIRQEVLLGIGGLRALRYLGREPSVFHMNEGHTAFLTLELLREEMAGGLSFEQAVEAVRSRCIFTTHTPVPAGHDRFDPASIERHLGWLRRELDLDERRFLGLGRLNPDDNNELFCMTVLGLKMSRAANGVSALHGAVSRQMWHGMWPDRSVDAVPIGHVTNGVHVPSWIAPEMAALLDTRMGTAWRERPWDAEAWAAVDDIPDILLWAVHKLLKERLLAFAEQVVREMPFHARRTDRLGPSDLLFSPDRLTIGFARRFATYKRGDLLFRDLARARHVLAHPERPVQILFAGKAHPQDFGGGEIIRNVVKATGDPVLSSHVAFIPDYDLSVARYLVRGVDVWLNTPRRPREASGTSGQKGPLNGVVNASTVDGWWCEAYDGQNGWNIGDDRGFASEWEQDQRDLHATLDLIEHTMAPLYYDRDPDGVPHRWIAQMKASMKSIAPRFNSCRMLREYSSQYYWPQSD